MKEKYKNTARGLLADTIFKLPFPEHMYIEPTNDCRLNCPICPTRAGRGGIGYLNFDIFKKIISETSSFNGLKSITLHKNGEPLLHPELPLMIRYIKKRLSPVKVSFSTSGAPFKKSITKDILHVSPDQIFITYGNHFANNAIAKNLKDFLKMRRALGKKKPKLTLRFIDKKGDFRILKTKKTKWRDISDEIEIRPYHTWCGYFQRPYAIARKRTPCLSLWTTLAINWNGDVSICSLDYAKKGIVGNVKMSNLGEIWKSEKLNGFRRRHLGNNYENLKPCQNCTEWRHNRRFWTVENLKKARLL